MSYATALSPCFVCATPALPRARCPVCGYGATGPASAPVGAAVLGLVLAVFLLARLGLALLVGWIW